MNKEQMIKYAMMAVGAYLVWKWLTGPGGFLDPAASAAAQVPGEDGKTPAVTAGDAAATETLQQTVARLATYYVEQIKPYNSSATVGNAQQAIMSLLNDYKTTYGNADGFEAYVKSQVDARVADEKRYAAQATYKPTGGYVIPTAPPAAVRVNPNDAALQDAAYDPTKAGLTGSYTMNAHQWNWYRMAKAVALGTFNQEQHQPALDSYGDPNLQYTASEYHALLSKAGLSGLSGMTRSWGAPAGMSAWRN